MATETLKGKLYRYRDSEGRVHDIWVEARTKTALETIDQYCRRQDRKWEKQHVAMTDLSRDGKVTADAGQATASVRQSQLGNPWEGPRYSFSHLLGESRTWNGEPFVDGYCKFCHQLPLGEETLCLGCTRSGKDDMVPRPTKADLAKRRPPAPKNDGLKGGKG